MSNRKIRCDRCAVCAWWEFERAVKSKAGVRWAKCRVSGPRLKSEESAVGFWPESSEFDWCGEFRTAFNNKFVKEGGGDDR